jgi:glycosyltransferase involved in cell wall biosynthesis
MRILHCITGLSGDGAQRMLLRLTHALRGHDVESAVVNLGQDEGVARNFEDAGIKVWSLNISANPVGVIKGARALGSLIDSFKPEIVQGWMYHANLLVYVASSCSRRKFAALWNIRRGLDDYSERRAKTRCVIKGNAYLSKNAGRIIYCSGISREQHERFGFSSKHGVVIENGFDTDRFQPRRGLRDGIRARYGIKDSEFLIGNIGRYDVAKGHRFLIEAFAKLKEPRARLLMIGRGVDSSNPDLTSMLERLGCRERVILLGEQSAVENILPGLDLYCSSSIAEGFPNAISEALTCGVPCVVTDTGASREIVSNLGWVVAPRDSEALSRGIEEAIAAGDERLRELGQMGRARIEERYGMKAIAERYYRVYEGANISGNGWPIN